MKFGVIGGGIGGLATAFYLRKALPDSKIVLFEASKRLGGWIRTTKFDDGTRHEHGPRTIRPAGIAGANTLQLIEELGMQEEITPVKQGHATTKNRLVLVNGELHKLPSSLTSVFRTQKPFERPLASVFFNDIRARKKEVNDEALYSFVARRLGDDVAKYLIDPMVRGICAGDAKKISAAAFVAGPLFELEQKYGGIFKGLLMSRFQRSPKVEDPQSDLVKKARSEKWSVWSCKNGLESFVKQFETKLIDQGVEIKKTSSMEKITFDNDQAFLTGSNSEETGFNHVFLTLPAHATAKLIPSLKTEFESIPFVTVAVVIVEFSKSVMNLEAFGFLVPSSEPEPILGTIFDTCTFPQGDKNIFTIMMGGHKFRDLFGENPDHNTLKDLGVSELKRILKISEDPYRVTVKIQRNCIPQYTVGHKERVQGIRNALTGTPLSLVGSSYDGVGINDVIMSAKTQVQKCLP